MAQDYGLLQVAPNRIGGSLSMAPVKTDTSMQEGAVALGGAANDYLKEIVAQANKTRVQDAINQFTQDLDNYKYNTNSGMMRRKGRDVALPEGGELFSVEGERGVEERIGKYFGGLNQAQKELAKDFISRTRMSNRNEFLRHEAQECDNYTVDVNDAAVKRARNSLAQNGRYKEAREADIQTIRDSYAIIGRVKGWSDEHVKNSADDAISGSLKDVINALLDDGNIREGTSLFNDSGRSGNLLGRDMIGLRKRLTKMRAAAAQKAQADAVMRDLATVSAPEFSATKSLRKEGFALPELTKLLEAEKDPRKKLKIEREWYGKYLSAAGGDTKKAMWAAVEAETPTEDVNEETVKRIERAAEAASELPTYEVPSVGELALRIMDLRKGTGITEEQAMALAAKVHKSWEAHIGSQKVMAEAQLDRGLKAIASGKDFDSLETDLLSAPMVEALQIRARKTAANELDVGDSATFFRIKAEKEKLPKMTEAEVRAAMASCSDAEIASMLALRQNMLANGGKIAYTKDTKISEAFSRALDNAESPLALDPKFKHVRAQYLDWVIKQIHAMEGDSGKGIDEKSLDTVMTQLIHHAAFFKDGPTIAQGKLPDFSRLPEVETALKEYCANRLGIEDARPGEMKEAVWWITSMDPGHKMTVGEANRLLPSWYWDTKVPSKFKAEGMQKRDLGQAIMREYLWFAMDAEAYKKAKETAAGEHVRTSDAKIRADLLEAPTIDLSAQPIVQNADGTVSTVRTITVEMDGDFYVLPTVIGGMVVPDETAIIHARATGKHLGKYQSQEAADAAAQRIHQQEERRVRSMR